MRAAALCNPLQRGQRRTGLVNASPDEDVLAGLVGTVGLCSEAVREAGPPDRARKRERDRERASRERDGVQRGALCNPTNCANLRARGHVSRK